MGYLLSIGIAVLAAYEIRTGKVIGFGGLTDRRFEPKLFWAMIAFRTVVAFTMLALGVAGIF